MKRRVLRVWGCCGVVVTVGCGAPDPQAECGAILATVETVRTESTQGLQTPQGVTQSAQTYEQVADDLEALSIRTLDIKQHFPMLVSGHRDVAEALSKRAELVDEQGVIPVGRADSEAAEEYRELQDEEIRAQNQIDTALGLITSNCQMMM